MTAPVRFPRFYVTSPSPCPYLPGKTERKVFTELRGEHADALNDALSRIGFRRSQTVAYRPSCADCRACVSVRVAASEFKASATQRRTMRRCEDLVVTECRPWATPEQYDLLQKYLGSRHPGGSMSEMDEMDYADMVEHTPVSTVVYEYREAAPAGQIGRLVGACLTDHQADGLSMIYSFYDPDYAERAGLGNYIILEHIKRAQQMSVPYVYLGYWVEGSARMQYKIRFRPLEKLGPDGWTRISEEDQERLIKNALTARREKIAPDGASKDGSMPQAQEAEQPEPASAERSLA